MEEHLGDARHAAAGRSGKQSQGDAFEDASTSLMRTRCVAPRPQRPSPQPDDPLARWSAHRRATATVTETTRVTPRSMTDFPVGGHVAAGHEMRLWGQQRVEHDD